MIEKVFRELLRREKTESDSSSYLYTKKRILNAEKKNITDADRVFLSRYENRPKACDFIDNILDEYILLHGDRRFSDDRAIIGGIGKIKDIVVTFIGIDKGKNLNESIEKNFGMAHPEGYRKAVRLMLQAEKFNRPIITFIDTPGAYPGIGAEERGQAEAIASSIYTMCGLNIPIITVITGEGCSGGAIGLSVCDYLIMMENSTYSILSPEGFASILWKDARKSDDASKIMKLGSKNLYEFGICDEVIEEDLVLKKEDFKNNFVKLKKSLYENLIRLDGIDRTELLKNRKRKFKI